MWTAPATCQGESCVVGIQQQRHALGELRYGPSTGDGGCREGVGVDFTVELEGLRALGGNLDHCAESLGSALDALREVGGGSLGRSSLDDACNRVQDDWRHGLDLIGKCSGKLSEGVKDCHSAYARVDHGLMRGFDKMIGG